MSVAGSYECLTKTPMGDQTSTFTVTPGDDGTSFTGSNVGSLGSLEVIDGKVKRWSDGTKPEKRN